MISFNQHKVKVLAKAFNIIKERGGINPSLFITTEDNKNVILAIPTDILEVESLRERANDILKYMSKVAKATHATMVSEVNMTKVEGSDLTDEEKEILTKRKPIPKELQEKLNNLKRDGLMINCFSRYTGKIEKDFMSFTKVNGTFVPDQDSTEALNKGDGRDVPEGRFTDILEI
tara:strand:- start:637 stop:1161 length:525 start_codon:yes stop_codon:yes gene_type:complete